MHRILATLAFVVLAAAAQAEDRPSTNDLVDRDFIPVAGGYLTMKRVFIVVPRWTGFTTQSDEIIAMSGEGYVPDGQLIDIIARKGVFVRLKKQAEEYVCVHYKTDTCYRVRSEE
ncbi:hypothetical protein MAUB1S_08341 [Mycolicibacterium aubagnense]